MMITMMTQFAGVTIDEPSLLGLVAAMGCGLLIGIERERRKGRGGAVIAGARTFTITALAGALAQWLAQPLLVALGGALVLGLVVAGYWRDRDPDRGITTELALFVTYLLGVTAMVNAGIAAAGGVIVAALLATRSQLHRFATVSLSEGELRDALILGGAALVVLPLMPADPVAWLAGIDLRRIWVLVVVLLAMQAAGHVAVRLLGPGPGLVVSGFASGFVSSTATFAAMGALFRRGPASGQPALAGAIASNLATLVLMAVVVTSASTALLSELWPSLAGGAVVTLAGVLIARRGAGQALDGPQPRSSVAAMSAREPAGPDDDTKVADGGDTGRAFRLLPSLGFALMLTAVTVAVSLANAYSVNPARW